MDKNKIIFAGHDLKFIEHIIKYFEEKLGYEVRIDQWNGHEVHNEQQSIELINWADIIFCEWGLGNVIWYQENKKDNQKLFVRLHRFEMNTKYPALFDYSKIDKLITISPFIFEEFYRVARVPRQSMSMIFNAVDIERFFIPKEKGFEYNLAIIGICPKLKRLDRAIDIFTKLYDQDSRFRLYIKGKHPKEYKWIWNNEVEREYYENIFKKIKNTKYEKVIHFEGWGDVGEFLTKIGYVLSTSDYESFHLAPIEGLASGAIPIVLNREGVKTIFDPSIIFNNLDEATEFILNSDFSLLNGLREKMLPQYSLDNICMQIDELIKRSLD